MEMRTRTFLALPLDPSYSKEAVRIVRMLRVTRARITWVRPENIHITLHFFGDLDDGSIRRVSHLVHSVTDSFLAFSLELDVLGAFPRVENPRIIWMGFRGDGAQLNTLYGCIRTVLKREGFPVEDKPFVPHATIGRVKAWQGDTAFVASLKKVSIQERARMHVSSILLYKSILTPQGPQYEVLETFPLSHEKDITSARS